MVPPIYLLLKHMEYCKAYGVLVLPYWSSAVFWPLIIDRPSTLKPFVKQALYFENPKYCVRQGPNKHCVIGSDQFKSPILALRICF